MRSTGTPAAVRRATTWPRIVDRSVDARPYDESASSGAAAGRQAVGRRTTSIALDELRRAPSIVPPEENYRQGLSLYEAGRVDEALVPLLSRRRRRRGLRFARGVACRANLSRSGRLRAGHRVVRASRAGAGADARGGPRLLFDLAEALEDAGETARALAICMELQADAGNYRDVAARIDRLANVRARG